MKKFAIILIGLFVVSCLREIPLKTSGVPDPIPVCHVFIQPDSQMTITLGMVTALSASNINLDGALFSVYQNGVLKGAVSNVGNGKYTSNIVLNEQDSFEIRGVENGKSFSAKGVVPGGINISKIDTATYPLPGVGPAFSIDFTFSDPASVANYYRIYLKKNYFQYSFDANNNLLDSQFYSVQIPISGSELPFIQNNFNNYTTAEILFDDATFNGIVSTFTAYTSGKPVRTKFIRPVSLEFTLENLGQSLFEYYNTRNAHLWQQQSIAQLPGAVLGNFEGAYGVAGAYVAIKKVILLP